MSMQAIVAIVSGAKVQRQLALCSRPTRVPHAAPWHRSALTLNRGGESSANSESFCLAYSRLANQQRLVFAWTLILKRCSGIVSHPRYGLGPAACIVQMEVEEDAE